MVLIGLSFLLANQQFCNITIGYFCLQDFQGLIIAFLPMMNANKHIANVIRSNAKGAANCSKVKGFAEDDLLDLAANAFAAFSNSSTK